jgi:choline dehydrogenase-like flavoprotein
MNERYDLVVVGSGAGGSAVAYKAVSAGARVLMLERGERLPRDGSTLDVKKVFKDGIFKNRQGWVDGQNRSFVPGEFHNVGGKTKWYGAALLRFSPHEFEADVAHQCLAWPFGYERLAPYYDEAERLLAVTRFDDEPELKELIGKITAGGPWRAQPLPLGLDRRILQNEQEAKHFDGFASPCGFKSDAERSLLDRIATAPGFSLVTGKRVSHLLPSSGDAAVIAGVRCADGSEYYGDVVVLAAGAMTSPRILQDYRDDSGFGAALPSATLVGANFKMHLNSAVLGFSPFVDTDVLRKTAILFNDEFPHSTVQCLGWIDGDILGAQLPAAVPKFVLRAAGSRAVGFFATTEDGSHAENRIVSCAGTGTPVMDYEVARIEPAWREHRALVQAFTARLLRAGLAGVDKFMGMAGTAHALGSLVAGNDAATSVVDANGRAHGFDNLYVGDGSVLPRSSRVNPALTIYAWGLRLGEHLVARTQGSTRPARAGSPA